MALPSKIYDIRNTQQKKLVGKEGTWTEYEVIRAHRPDLLGVSLELQTWLDHVRTALRMGFNLETAATWANIRVGMNKPPLRTQRKSQTEKAAFGDTSKAFLASTKGKG